jgi:hypothetical protein
MPLAFHTSMIATYESTMIRQLGSYEFARTKSIR